MQNFENILQQVKLNIKQEKTKWKIQVGVYSNLESAHSTLSKLADVLIKEIPYTNNKSKIYVAIYPQSNSNYLLVVESKSTTHNL